MFNSEVDPIEKYITFEPVTTDEMERLMNTISKLTEDDENETVMNLYDDV